MKKFIIWNLVLAVVFMFLATGCGGGSGASVGCQELKTELTNVGGTMWGCHTLLDGVLSQSSTVFAFKEDGASTVLIVNADSEITNANESASWETTSCTSAKVTTSADSYISITNITGINGGSFEADMSANTSGETLASTHKQCALLQ